MTSIRTSAVIDPDGAITVNVPDLRPGQMVEVTIETRIPDTPEEAVERERLAQTIAPGKLASDIVIEDRGPR